MVVELRVACVQPLSVVGGLEATIAHHAEAIVAAGSDLVVFPELSLTGYDLGAPTVDVDDDRLEPLVDACGAAAALALVGAPVTGPAGAEHIGVIAIDHSGARIVYHKLYVGDDEAGRFAAGADPSVVEIDGWRLGLAMCRDTGIVEHAAATAALGIDAYLAGVVDHPEDAEVQLERGRRIAEKHGVWVGVASSAAAATSGFDRTAGRSFILAPDGEIVDRVGPEVGAIARATLRRD